MPDRKGREAPGAPRPGRRQAGLKAETIPVSGGVPARYCLPHPHGLVRADDF